MTDRELLEFQLLGSDLNTIEIDKHINLSTKKKKAYREHRKDHLALADSVAFLLAATLLMETGCIS